MTASALGSPTRSGVALAGYLTALCSSLLTWETAATGLGRWSHRSTMGGSGGEAHDWHPYPHPTPTPTRGLRSHKASVKLPGRAVLGRPSVTSDCEKLRNRKSDLA